MRRAQVTIGAQVQKTGVVARSLGPLGVRIGGGLDKSRGNGTQTKPMGLPYSLRTKTGNVLLLREDILDRVRFTISHLFMQCFTNVFVCRCIHDSAF